MSKAKDSLNRVIIFNVGTKCQSLESRNYSG